MVKQLSVFVHNEAGRIAAVTRALAEEGIDLRAISVADTADFGILRLLVSDCAKGSEVLSACGYIVSVTDVVAAAVPDRPGGLSAVLDLLDSQKMDIEYMYSLFGRDSDSAYMVFRVEDGQRLEALLNAAGIRTLSMEELGLR